MALAETDNGSGGEQGDSEDALKASVLGGFSHIDETKTLISSLLEVHSEMLTRELATERFGGKTAPHESALKACLFCLHCSSFSLSIGIMNLYQEQPHLLDPHLGTCQVNTSKFKQRKMPAIILFFFFLDWMVTMILEFIKTETSPPSLVHLCFKFLYIICKVS